MSDSDRTRKELLEELRRVRRRVEALEKEQKESAPERAPAGPTRREVLKAAWVSPIVLSLGIPGPASAGTETTTGEPTNEPTNNPTTPEPTNEPTNEPTSNGTTREPPTTSTTTTAQTTREPTNEPTQSPTTPPQVPVIPILDPDA